MDLPVGTLQIDFTARCAKTSTGHHLTTGLDLNLTRRTRLTLGVVDYAEDVAGPGSGSSLGFVDCGCYTPDVFAAADQVLARRGFTRTGDYRQAEDGFWQAVVVRTEA
ncbi:hypothetical protein [Isoptericola sp. NPDC056605]|uniref:hypothetical protein n=1 Tax=Isoptericola sp. NPDC056605 TaxID=3345876 RepID=UPI00367F38D7